MSSKLKKFSVTAALVLTGLMALASQPHGSVSSATDNHPLPIDDAIVASI